ncbi:hypothetical protein PsYK624_073710 [Phanerochaete sordida]|uniref:Uncharacterized protein n=1 Tax=Phanerochaete sordida TaxID=48140 RepID=A0A9P3G8I0_9APHY|nr:hypothetical protein PsYK624_073710 [Phanerochaete sordida]
MRTTLIPIPERIPLPSLRQLDLSGPLEKTASFLTQLALPPPTILRLNHTTHQGPATEVASALTLALSDRYNGAPGAHAPLPPRLQAARWVAAGRKWEAWPAALDAQALLATEDPPALRVLLGNPRLDHAAALTSAALAAGQRLTHVAVSACYATTRLEWTALLAGAPYLRELAVAQEGFQELVGVGSHASLLNFRRGGTVVLPYRARAGGRGRGPCAGAARARAQEYLGRAPQDAREQCGVAGVPRRARAAGAGWARPAMARSPAVRASGWRGYRGRATRCRVC